MGASFASHGLRKNLRMPAPRCAAAKLKARGSSTCCCAVVTGPGGTDAGAVAADAAAIVGADVVATETDDSRAEMSTGSSARFFDG